jgi:hypothetical protein
MSASYTGLPCMRPRTPCYPFGIRLKNLVVGRAVNDERMNLQGYCAWEACDDPRSLVTVAIAGPSADWIFFDVSRSADSQDYRDAHCGARRVAEAEGGEVEAIIARARVDAESLIQQHVAVIKTLAHELMQARWCELSGEEVERILAQSGVERPHAPAAMPDYPPGISSYGRGPQRGTEYGFERRGGALVRVPRPDPLRATAPFEHRDDGYIA